MRIARIIIKRFRSINNLTIDIEKDTPLVICGANNVGKTNFLRALDLFFSLDPSKFDTKKDIPYDIEEGRRGGSYNTAITGVFIDSDNSKYEITAIFKRKRETGNILQIKAKKDGVKILEDKAKEIINSFRFLFIEASNVDIPKIIAEVVDEEVLPLGLDQLRKRQTVPLEKLRDFIEVSKESVKGIEKGIDKNLNEFITEIPGIDSKDWKIKILFAEYDKLREALSGLIDFTLYDRNERKLESKGSGIQRVILLALMKYITDRSERQIIWGIDEPGAFLQPSLQKRTFEVLKKTSEKTGCLPYNPLSILCRYSKFEEYLFI